MKWQKKVRFRYVNGRFLFLPLILVVPLGREGLDLADLQVQHPPGLLGHPLLLIGVWDGATHRALFPDQNEGSGVPEKHGSTHNCHSFLLLFISAKLLLNLMWYNSAFPLIHRLLQGFVLLLFPGFLADRKGSWHGPHQVRDSCIDPWRVKSSLLTILPCARIHTEVEVAHLPIRPHTLVVDILPRLRTPPLQSAVRTATALYTLALKPILIQLDKPFTFRLWLLKGGAFYQFVQSHSCASAYSRDKDHTCLIHRHILSIFNTQQQHNNYWGNEWRGEKERILYVKYQ